MPTATRWQSNALFTVILVGIDDVVQGVLIFEVFYSCYWGYA